MTRILLVRHAENNYTQTGKLAGWIKDFDGDISKIIPDSNGQYSGKDRKSVV